MKFFRPRGRSGAGPATGNPLSRALALYKDGRYAEAEAEARGLAEAPFRLPDDRLAPMAMFVAALSMGAQGRHGEALAAYDALLPVFGGVFGAEAQETLILRSNRAQALTVLGRHSEGEAECAAVASVAVRSAWPLAQLITAAARSGQIYALNAQRRHREAEALAREVLARPVPSRFAVIVRAGLARSLNGQARRAEALAEAEHADDQRRGLPEEWGRPDVGVIEVVSATALLGLGRDSEARALASTAHDACLAAFGPDHYRTAEAKMLLDGIGGA